MDYNNTRVMYPALMDTLSINISTINITAASQLKYYNKTRMYLALMDTLQKSTNVSDSLLYQLKDYNRTTYQADLEDIYSRPMLTIGLYIAVASLVCVIAMGADLLLGLRSKKLWIPCKWFTINAFYLTVIAVTMKLPVDLSGLMPGVVDQVSKLGSMAFMCTMMSYLLPCLATMDRNELLTNITALFVLVITLVVNVCIQISTGVVSSPGTKLSDTELKEIITSDKPPGDLKALYGLSYNTIATIYVTLLLVLLIIYVSSSLAILKCKQIIESKYQQAHETALKNLQRSAILLSVEELQQHVSNHWIMAGSGSPQFIFNIACAATTTASGVICCVIYIFHTLTMFDTLNHIGGEYDSDYKESTLVILIVQFIGVLVGMVATLVRFFATLSFKVSITVILNHIDVFTVESYWTQKLSDWKHKRLPFRFRRLNRKGNFNNLKSFVLDCCIILQKTFVVLCKLIALIPLFIMCVSFYCLQVVFSSSGERTDVKFDQSPYVLLLDNDIELAESTLKHLSKSLNRLIQKSEKKHPNNLMKLIEEKSTISFQGVKKFDNNNDCDCWSLALVTLTTIAVTLGDTKKVEIDSLMKSVREGLEYVSLVEENLNATNDDNVRIQKAAQRLWQEVDVDHKWLGINLQDIADQMNTASSQDDTTLSIVQEFFTKAEYKISDNGVGSTNSGGTIGDSEFTSICMKSMYHITKTIIDDHKESHKKSFDELISSRIADLMAACLTNLPQVIEMKCHTDAIEKREESVMVAAKLLGETKRIINILRDRDVPSKNDRPFINKWGAYLSEP